MRCGKFDRAFWNVVMQSLSVMIGASAVVALFNAESYIVESEKRLYANFHPEALYGMFGFNISADLFLFITPSLISVIGPRITLVFGVVSRLIFVLSFFVPVDWVFYCGSIFGGVNFALIFGAEGVYRIMNSTQDTITRNATVFCLIVQTAFLIGNTCIFFTVQREILDVRSIRLFLIICTVFSCLPFVFMALMTKAVYNLVRRKTPKEIFVELLKLFTEKDMVLMYVPMFYCGLVQAIAVGVYSSSLAFSKQYSMNSTMLVSLSGMLIGLGEVVGGVVFVLLARTRRKTGFRYYMLFGFILNTIIQIVVLLTLPINCTKGATEDRPFLKSNLPLALACSVLIGFGDNCIFTQNYGFVGKRFSDKSGPATTILTLARSTGVAIGFLGAKGGYGVLFGIIFVFGIVGVVTFFIVETSPSYFPEVQPDPKEILEQRTL